MAARIRRREFLVTLGGVAARGARADVEGRIPNETRPHHCVGRRRGPDGYCRAHARRKAFSDVGPDGVHREQGRRRRQHRQRIRRAVRSRRIHNLVHRRVPCGEHPPNPCPAAAPVLQTIAHRRMEAINRPILLWSYRETKRMISPAFRTAAHSGSGDVTCGEFCDEQLDLRYICALITAFGRCE
jgi:hypothetical protein